PPLPPFPTRRSSDLRGNIALTASTLRILSGGELSAKTLGAGHGGDVMVVAHDLMIDGSRQGTGILTTSGTLGGKAGSITVKANRSEEHTSELQSRSD